MIKFKGVLFSIFFAAVPALGADPITLEEAQIIALRENLELRSMARQAEADLYFSKRTSSPFLPKLGVEARYESFQSSFEDLKGSTSNLFAEWNIFSGFRDYQTLSAAGIQSGQSQVRYQTLERNLRWDVEVAFSAVLRISESIRIIQDAIKRNDLDQALARKRRGAGLVSEADVLEFDLEDSLLKGELSTLEGALRVAELDLATLLGGKVYPIRGKLIHYHVKETLESALARLPKESGDIEVARLEVEKADALARASRGGFLPTVDLRATYGSRGLQETLVTPETAIMAQLRWELFSGFDTVNSFREARAVQGRANAQLEAQLLNSRAEVERGLIRLKVLQDRVDYEVLNQERAQKYFQTVTEEYRRGIKNSPDLRSASQQWTEALIRDLVYRFDFIEQKVRVQKAIGGEIAVVRGSAEGHKD